MEHVTSPDGTQIAYRVGGTGDRILFVHGAIASSSDWTFVARALRERFTIVTMDRRGRGRSGAGTEPYAIGREAQDIAAALAASGARIVVAHSYGALCTLAALDDGAPVERVVLYEPPVSIPRDAAGGPGALGAHLKAGRRDEAVAGFLAAAGATDAELALIRDSPAWPGLLEAVPTLPRELSEVRRWSTPPGPFDIPALLLVGADTTSPTYRAGLPALERAFPRLRRLEFEGQKHLAHVMAAEAFAAAVGDWIQEV